LPLSKYINKENYRKRCKEKCSRRKSVARKPRLASGHLRQKRRRGANNAVERDGKTVRS